MWRRSVVRVVGISFKGGGRKCMCTGMVWERRRGGRGGVLHKILPQHHVFPWVEHAD